MHDRLALQLQDDLTGRIAQTGARGVLIDISALEIVDSFIGRMIANIAAMARVLDAQTVVTGMQPAIAITLVELGLTLTGVRTALNVEQGMAMLRAALADEGSRSRRRGRLPTAARKWMPPAKVDSLQIRTRSRHRDRAPGRPRAGRGSRLQPRRSDQDRDGGERAGPQHARLRRRRHRRDRSSCIEPPRQGLRMTFEDKGPGIPDIAQALRDGFTSGNGLGPRARRGPTTDERIRDPFAPG